MSYRIQRLNELIKQVLGKIIFENEEFGSGVLATIMAVNVSPDGQHANVLVSVFPTNKGKPVFEKLNSDIFHLQQLLNKELQMRPVPKIRFVLDQTEAQAQELEGFLKKEK